MHVIKISLLRVRVFVFGVLQADTNSGAMLANMVAAFSGGGMKSVYHGYIPFMLKAPPLLNAPKCITGAALTHQLLQITPTLRR